MATAPRPIKPSVLPVQPENIPELLRAQPSWGCWKAGILKQNGKFDKVPIDPDTGRAVNGREKAQWRTFTKVVETYHKGKADGIGFVLSDKHPIIVDGVGYYVTVADYDQCAARMGEIYALWLELGRPLTEVSPSNKGLHM